MVTFTLSVFLHFPTHSTPQFLLRAAVCYAIIYIHYACSGCSHLYLRYIEPATIAGGKKRGSKVVKYQKPKAAKGAGGCVGSRVLQAKTNKSSSAAADTATVASFRLPLPMTNFCQPFKHFFSHYPFFFVYYTPIFCALSAWVLRLAVELWLRLLPKFVFF